MNLTFAFGIIFLFVACPGYQGMVSEREQQMETALNQALGAKGQYDAIHENGGLDRVTHAINDEGRFARILAKIGAFGIGLRRGTNLKGACYALSDFGEDVNPEWLDHPYSSQIRRTEEWYEKLYNSIVLILNKEEEEVAPLLLVPNAHPTGESYNVASTRIGIGEQRTFRKAVIPENSQQLGQDLQLNVIDSLSDMIGTVEKVLRWIERTSGHL